MLVLVGSNLVETMPPAARHLDRLRERGGKVVVIDPRRTPTARPRRPPPPAGAGHRPRARAGGAAPARRRRRGRPVLPRRAHHRVGGRARLGRLLVARARRAGHRDRRATRCGRWRPCWRALASWCSPRAGRSSTRPARTPCWPGSTSPSRWAWSAGAVRGLRLPDRPGQRPGRARARAEGRPAARLPVIDDPAARAHVAGVWGVDPDALPGPGRSAYELLDALGTPDGPSALLVLGSNIVVCAPQRDPRDLAAGGARPARGRRHRDVGDRGAGRRRAAGDAVGRGDRHDDQPRGPGGPAAARDHAADGRALATWRCSPGWPSGSARRSSFPTDPEEVFAELGRASAGGRADYSAITYDRIRDEQGVFWPCPPAASGSSPSPSRTPTAGPGSYAVEHRGAAEQPCADYPIHLTTGRVLAQYQSGAQTRRVRYAARRRAVRRDAPDARRTARRRATATPVRVTTRRGEMTAPARVVPTIRPDTVFVPFHWVGANRLTNDALDPASPDAGVQGVRRPPLAGGPCLSGPSGSWSSAAGWPPSG